MITNNKNTGRNTGSGLHCQVGEKKPYGGSKPLCSKCNYHHDGLSCAPKCNKWQQELSIWPRDIGHFKMECTSRRTKIWYFKVELAMLQQKVSALGPCRDKPDSNVLWFQAVIVCAEKIIRIPWGNEILIGHGDRSN
ncbi:hypothetical protein Tco_0382394 [Tanacetum coccineum]